MKQIVLILLLTMLTAGCCVREKVIAENEFLRITDSLSVYPFDNMQISDGVVMGMFCTEHFLVVTMDRSDYHFCVFPLESSYGEKYECIRKGRGPQEIVNMDYKSIKVGQGDTFSFFDYDGYKKVSLFATNAYISDVDEWKVKSNWGVSNGRQFYANTWVDLNILDKNQEMEYVQYGQDNSVTNYFSPYPKWCEDNSIEPPFLYLKNFIADSDGKNFAAFYAHFPAVRFFRNGSKKPITIKIGNDFYSEDPMTRICYSSRPFFSESLVCSLFNGKESSEIHQWDWTGDLLKRTVLSHRVSLICMDECRKVYYAYSRNEGKYYRSDAQL